MPSSWKAAFGILLIFAFGCISGALSTSVYFHQNPDLLLSRNPAATADMLQKRLTHHLDLDPDQRRNIHQILMDYLEQRRQLQTRIQPDIQTLNIQMVRQIRTVLPPDQVDGFHDNVVAFRRSLARAAFGHPNPNSSSSAPLGTTNAPFAAPLPSGRN